eukprot:Filipodium_phascolosomae@DN2093_c0_g1_i1.p2
MWRVAALCALTLLPASSFGVAVAGAPPGKAFIATTPGPPAPQPPAPPAYQIPRVPSGIKVVNDTLFNVRGNFWVGFFNVGSHCTLVKLSEDSFVFLDSFGLTEEQLNFVYNMTDSGKKVTAIINVHPFHTVYAEWMHNHFPHAKLYGTRRHKTEVPDLPWEKEQTETQEFQNLYKQHFQFSIPSGVDFISSDPNIHFSSILVYHKATKSLHVDDTFIVVKAPLVPKSWTVVRLHPTLGTALLKRAGAADELVNWVETLKLLEVENIFAAHMGLLVKEDGVDINSRLQYTLVAANSTINEHRKKYGGVSFHLTKE